MRFQTRPTWLAVLVAAVTGYCLAKPDTITGAFREDGLPFIMVGMMIVGVMVKAAVECAQERHDNRQREAEWDRTYRQQNRRR